jgi:hypothetical protein
LRAREKTAAQQTMIGDDNVPYVINVEVGEVLRRGGKASAELDTRLRVGNSDALSTSVNVPDGQTVVLGTARPDARRAALILVVTPEIR